MIFPVGDGIGATQEACAVKSPMRAAGRLLIIVVPEPFDISPGPAGTHGISVQILVMSETRAAGMFPISTVGAQGLRIGSGSGGCGTGVGVGAGGWMGAWQCGASCNTISIMRAAGFDISKTLKEYLHPVDYRRVGDNRQRRRYWDPQITA